MIEHAEMRLHGAPNFRDFGGCRTADGRRVRRAQLFRSEALSELNARDHVQLAALGIRLVCDLRSAPERLHRPTRWPAASPDILLMEIDADLRTGDAGLLDILRADPTAHGAGRMMMQVYQMIPVALHGQLHGLFGRLANGDGAPLLMHCTAGKDRTGVLAAIILLALGVAREDVVADYLLTEQLRDQLRFEAKVADVMAHMLGAAPQAEAVTALAAVKVCYLDAAFQRIEEQHGSLERYLAAAGIDTAMLDMVRAHLLED